MIEVKNRLFQPLSLHARDGRGLHLGPRASLHLADEDLSPEIEAAARRGAVSLTPVNAESGTRNAEQDERDTEQQTREDSTITRATFQEPTMAARAPRKRRT